MKYRGRIESINNIVVSDPSYGKNVWCRYERNSINDINWMVNLNIEHTETKLDDYVIKGNEFSVLLHKNEKDCSLDDEGTLRYLNNIEIKDYTIGMDSACVALGINEKANKILDSKEEWQPKYSIKTGMDGTFGEVLEGMKDGKTCFILITGYVEEEFINQDDLLDYLKKQFEIIDLIKEKENDNKCMESDYKEILEIDENIDLTNTF